LARWSSIAEEEEYGVVSGDAYVASTRIPCPNCGQETDVIAMHCSSGTVLDEPLERFTVSDIRAVD
jgi:ribosomal protein S27AE